MVKAWVSSFVFRAAAAVLALNLKLSFPVSRMWQRRVSRSSSPVVILASPKTVAHSLKLRLVVMATLDHPHMLTQDLSFGGNHQPVRIGEVFQQ